MDAGEELTAHNVLPHEDAALKESEHLGWEGSKPSILRWWSRG